MPAAALEAVAATPPVCDGAKRLSLAEDDVLPKCTFAVKVVPRGKHRVGGKEVQALLFGKRRRWVIAQ